MYLIYQNAFKLCRFRKNILLIFTGKAELQRGNESKREIFRLLAHSPNGLQNWLRIKPGGRSSIRVSHMGASAFGSSFSGISVESWIESRADRTQIGAHTGFQHCRWWLTPQY